MPRRPIVASQLLLQPHSMFQSIGHRAWHAYFCLPRDEKGKPPSYRALEREQGLNNGPIQKMIKGNLTRPGVDVHNKIAKALSADPHWLQTGEGDPPRAAWPIPAYPYGSSASLSSKAKAAFDSDAKKLAQGGLVRAKRARK